MIKIFVLGSGRSGTKYISYLFKNNILNCKSVHQPEPDMLGESIYWYQTGEFDKIKYKFYEKRKIIENYEKSNINVYIETSHAFLKSFCDIATEVFPDIKLIHVIRNPLNVAKSQYNRKRGWVGEPCFVLPFNFFQGDKKRSPNYKGSDGQMYCRWALTGKEQIFHDINLNLTRYQKLLLQWIEIENRAIKYLDRYEKHHDCYTIHVPHDLNDEDKIGDMFRFFNLDYKQGKIVFKGDKNASKKPTVITNDDRKQLEELINYIPDSYLEIFQKDPYTLYEWVDLLKK